ncbi:MAG TPA: proton-conducting transporter membrane subunit [Methylomirabilota bacterium]
MRAHLPVLPPLLALAGALLVALSTPLRGRGARPLAVGAAAASAAAALAGIADVLARGPHRYALGGWAPPWGIEAVLDPLSAFMMAVVALVATVALAAGPGVTTVYGRSSSTFYALALVAVAGFLGIVASGDLFNVFVFLEIAAIASYALVASAGGPGLLAGFRYLVLGTVGASFYLLGVGLLYVLTGSLNMADLADRLPALSGSPLFAAGVAFVAVGLAIKMGLFPLHGWLPDAYTHAPPPVASLLAGVATKAAAYALARTVLYVLRPGDLPVGTTLAWVGAASILAGGVLALRQTDARRLLAYSSVSQMGYVALGLGLANAPALAGAYLHLLNHAMMKAALFLGVGALALQGRGPALSALRFGPRASVLGVTMVVAALSMVGVPPAGGFFSKWYLLQGAVEATQPGLVAVILIGSVLALGYCYRLTEAVWFPPVDGAPAPDTPRAVRLGLVTLAVGILLVGLVSGAIVERLLLPAAAPAVR